ncbi:hypothetical protein B0H14DRAFT_3177456, partial [Mycena olivaceomarginata]
MYHECPSEALQTPLWGQRVQGTGISYLFLTHALSAKALELALESKNSQNSLINGSDRGNPKPRRLIPETWRHVLRQLSPIRQVMQDVAVAVKVINYMNIHGGVGGKGGAGGEQGGGGGAGEGPSINYAVEAGNITVFMAQEPERQRQINSSEIEQSKAALALVQIVLLPPRYSRVGKIFLKKWQNIKHLDAHMETLSSPHETQLAGHGPQSYSKVGDMDETNAIDLLLLRAVKRKPLKPLSRLQRLLSLIAFLGILIYRKNRANILEWRATQSHDDYELTVYTTWQISFKQLSKVAAQAIFEQAAEWKTNDAGQEAQILQAARGFLQNFLSASGTWDQQCLMDIVAEIQGQVQRSRAFGSYGAGEAEAAPWSRPSRHPAGYGKSGCHIANLEGTKRQSHSNCAEKRSSSLEQTIQTPCGYGKSAHTQLGRYKEAEPLEALCWRSGSSSLEQTIQTPAAMANLAAHTPTWKVQRGRATRSTVLEKRKQL